MSAMAQATAVSCANIAFIKYWGNRDPALRLPGNGSISMNLAGIETTTTVMFDERLGQDELTIDGEAIEGPKLERVSHHLGHIREQTGISAHARVISENSFPMGAGLASSASAFAALTVAACAAAGVEVKEAELSALARLGSGSACRSVPGGFVEWYAGDGHASSYAKSIAPPEYWDLVDLIAMISGKHKMVGSTEGHAIAKTSPLQKARLADTPRRLAVCREAILARDFEALGTVAEQDALMMHGIMMTSEPPLLYWEPGTLRVMRAVVEWREREGLPAFYTIDAGANVHVLTTQEHSEELAQALRALGDVQEVLFATPGGATRLVDRA